MIRRPPRSTQSRSSAASDVYKRQASVLARSVSNGINLRPVDEETLGVSLDETTTDETLAMVVTAFGGDPSDLGPVGRTSGIPGDKTRSATFLEHPVFHRYRSKHEM